MLKQRLQNVQMQALVSPGIAWKAWHKKYSQASIFTFICCRMPATL